MTGQVEELKSTVDDISSKVRRRDTILSSRGATGSGLETKVSKFGSAELRSRRGPSAFILASLIEWSSALL